MPWLKTAAAQTSGSAKIARDNSFDQWWEACGLPDVVGL